MDSQSNKSVWDVMVLEMNHHGDDDGSYTAARFNSKHLAIEYARRIVWESVQNLRRPGMTPKDLRETWYCLGDDAGVSGTAYWGSSELDWFIANTATPEDLDLATLEKMALPPLVKTTTPNPSASSTVVFPQNAPSLSAPDSHPPAPPVPSSSEVECVFLRLARAWHTDVETASANAPLPRLADIRALSCLLLSTEWKRELGVKAESQITANCRLTAKRQPRAWMDKLPWDLCMVALNPPSHKVETVLELTVNLDHHNSGIRFWMMEIAWFVVPLLNAPEATSRLLKNLADTLMGPLAAAGLAARFFPHPDAFAAFAKSFTPPKDFADQYADRLKTVEQYGIQRAQTTFWHTEASCRTEIQKATFVPSYPDPA